MSKTIYAVTVYLKSGSQLKFHTHKLEFTRVGSEIRSLEWESVENSPHNSLRHLDLTQVEAFTSTQISEDDLTY